VADALIARYGFARDDILLLLDQAATRQRILAGIREHLVGSAEPGAELVFFYAGHGSQVANSKSDEPDGRDESLVPADSRLGAPDIRDKELRRLLGQVLNRGARLTVIIDSCHSGSAARGIPRQSMVRGVRFDPRDVAEGDATGPSLEERGAVILSAAQDFEQALEAWDDEHGHHHGAFTLSLLRAIRLSTKGEGTEAIFQRARSWLHGPEAMGQEPVLAGRSDSLKRPFLGETPKTSRAISGLQERPVVAVEAVREGGQVVLQSGWIHGIDIGSELVAISTDYQGPPTRLRIAALEGITRSRAQIAPSPAAGNGDVPRDEVRPGDLFALDGWTVPPGPPLRLWVPTADEPARRWAAELAEATAVTDGVVLSPDPTEGEPPTHVLDRSRNGWELVSGEGSEPLDQVKPSVVLAKLRHWTSLPRLFVAQPASSNLARELEAVTRNGKVELTSDPARADYFLVGRRHEGGLEFAWVLPGVTSKGKGHSLLPLRSRWHAAPSAAMQGQPPIAERLADDAASLARIRAWLRLSEESPPSDRFPYRLSLRPDERDRSVRTSGELVEGELYSLQLSASKAELTQPIGRRYVYAFVIDSFGRCTLLYPPASHGPVENRFPLEPLPPYLPEIPLGRQPLFRVSKPFGVDHYYLLATDKQIFNPRILECPGVRGARGDESRSALEELLTLTGAKTRGAEKTLTGPERWSLERMTFRSRPVSSE
jgi:hypothetical protein